MPEQPEQPEQPEPYDSTAELTAHLLDHAWSGHTLWPPRWTQPRPPHPPEPQSRRAGLLGGPLGGEHERIDDPDAPSAGGPDPRL